MNSGAEGKAEGETKEKLEIAQNLLAAKADINLISQVTGLSVQEYRKAKSWVKLSQYESESTPS